MDQPGLIVPLATAFTDDASSLSEIRIARVVQWHKERGAAGFMIGSAAGEVTSLSLAERKDLAGYVMREAGDMPLYVNVTANTTPMAMDLCQDAFDCSAAGAVVCPPSPGGLTNEEMTNYLRAIRRHGRLAFGFLDPTGKYEVDPSDYLQPGVSVPLPLVEKGMGDLACLGTGPSECWTPRGIVHPVGVFGGEYGRRLLDKWAVFQKPVTALFKAYGLHRVAKYVFEQDGIDLGPPRPPFGRLGEKGRQVVDQLLGSLR